MWSAYIRYWIVSLVTLASLIATVDVIVDPYGLFGVRDFPGVNVIKPAATTRTRVVKLVQGERAEPSTLILGNSRPELGLDPESTAWPENAKPVFNAGIPGASVYTVMRYGQDIVSVSPTKLILWGLDFADFINRPASEAEQCQWPPTSAEWEDRLRVDPSMHPSDGWRTARAKDYAVAALSTQALMDSIVTLASQRKPGSGTRTRLGFNPAHDYWPIIRSEGQHVLFAQKNAEMRERFFGADFILVAKSCNSSIDFHSVATFIEMMHARGVEVILFINPYHADYLEIIWKAGLWPLFSEWKQRLTALVADSGSSAEIWDFSLLNRYTMEPPPTRQAGEVSLVWFWEPAHYRSELGDLILQDILDSGPTGRDRVGVRLSPQELGALLTQQESMAHSLWGPAPPSR